MRPAPSRSERTPYSDDGPGTSAPVKRSDAAAVTVHLVRRGAWLHLRGRIEARLVELRGQVRARPANVLGGLSDLRAEWADLTLDRRRAIIVTVLAQVELLPVGRTRNRFDPDRVRLTWRA